MFIISIQKFNKDIFEPLLDNIAEEDKTCAITGDFNIDLLKIDNDDDANSFINITSQGLCQSH